MDDPASHEAAETENSAARKCVVAELGSGKSHLMRCLIAAGVAGGRPLASGSCLATAEHDPQQDLHATISQSGHMGAGFVKDLRQSKRRGHPRLQPLEDRLALNFSSPVDYGLGPQSTTADFTLDGKNDLVVTTNYNSTRGSVAIMLGHGDGTFMSPKYSRAGFHPRGVAADDFNGDSFPDLVVANDKMVDGYGSVLLGNGDGSFRPRTSFFTGQSSDWVAVGHLNQDNYLDVAVTLYIGRVGILLDEGDSTFEPVVTYGVGGNSLSVEVADLNGDCSTDLAVANYLYSNGAVKCPLRNGDGAFEPSSSYPVPGAPYSLKISNFNSDSMPDTAVSFQYGSAIAVLLKSGKGRFGSPVNYGIGPAPRGLVIADFSWDRYAYTFVFGAMDSGKATSLVTPQMLSCRDPQRELYDTGGERRRRMGHKVMFLDRFRVASEPDGFNPPAAFSAEPSGSLDECLALTEALVLRTREDSDPYRSNAAEMIIAAVLAWLRTSSRRDRSAERKWTSVLNKLNRRLWFLDPPVVAICRIATIFDHAMAVYLVLPLHHSEVPRGLLRLRVTTHLRAASNRTGDDRGRVFLVLDEAKSLGRVETLEDILATGRCYVVRFVLFPQTLDQVEICFTKWDQILLDNRTLFCVNDLETAIHVDERRREGTIAVGGVQPRPQPNAQGGALAACSTDNGHLAAVRSLSSKNMRSPVAWEIGTCGGVASDVPRRRRRCPFQTFNDCFAHVLALGVTGSGKTSGLANLALDFMDHNSRPGMMWCCVKEYKADQAVRLAALVFGASSGHCLDPAQWELSRPGGSPESLAQFNDRGSGIGTRNSGKVEVKLWEEYKRIASWHAIMLANLAGMQPSPKLVYEIICSMPANLVEGTEDKWWETTCGQCLALADRRSNTARLSVKEDLEFDQCFAFFADQVPKLGDRFAGSVIGTSVSCLMPFLFEPFASSFASGVQRLWPEWCLEGAIVILDWPILANSAGAVAQAAFVQVVQQAALQRIAGEDRPVGIFRDEAHFCVHPEFDARILTVARSHRLAHFDLVQILPTMQPAFSGSPRGEQETEMFIAAHKSVVVFANNCQETTQPFSELLGTGKRMLYGFSQHPGFLDSLLGADRQRDLDGKFAVLLRRESAARTRIADPREKNAHRSRGKELRNCGTTTGRPPSAAGKDSRSPYLLGTFPRSRWPAVAWGRRGRPGPPGHTGQNRFCAALLSTGA